MYTLSYFYGVGPLFQGLTVQYNRELVSYGTKERVATKQNKYSPSRVQ